MQVQHRLFSPGKVNSSRPSGLAFLSLIPVMTSSVRSLNFDVHTAAPRCAVSAVWGERNCAVPRAGFGRSAGEQRRGDRICAGGAGVLRLMGSLLERFGLSVFVFLICCLSFEE